MSTTKIGILVYEYQSIDVVGPLDLLFNSSKWVLEYFSKHLPSLTDPETIKKAPSFEMYHISENLEPVALMTSGLRIIPQVTLDGCPEIDCLLIGGPMPETFKMSPSYTDFIKRHVAAGKVVWTTCTGALVLAQTGVLDGRDATVNNVEYSWIAKEYPKVKWTRTKKWVVDGNIWTGGGAIAGMDMVAEWIRKTYGLDVLIAGARGLDFEPRDVDGLHTVIPHRFDKNGKQISTTEFD